MYYLNCPTCRMILEDNSPQAVGDTSKSVVGDLPKPSDDARLNRHVERFRRLTTHSDESESESRAATPLRGEVRSTPVMSRRSDQNARLKVNVFQERIFNKHCLD